MTVAGGAEGLLAWAWGELSVQEEGCYGRTIAIKLFPLEYPGVDIARTLGTEAEWKFGDPLQITNERKELVKTHELKDVWVGVLVAAVNLPDDSFVSILAGESLRFNDSGMGFSSIVCWESDLIGMVGRISTKSNRIARSSARAPLHPSLNDIWNSATRISSRNAFHWVRLSWDASVQKVLMCPRHPPMQ